MGDFLQSILGGPSAPGPIAVPPMTGDPAAMNPGMKMFGITPEMLAGPQGITGMGGISEAGAVPGNSQLPDAVVQAFKPKKMNFFQALGDQLLMHWGNKPIFEKRNHDKNMKRAMEGFTSDPTEAISRISQFDPDLAWQLLNTVQDNQRQNAVLERQNRALDMRNDDYLYQQTAGMMGAATPETWGQMRDLALKRAAARNGNVEALAGIIPEQYDPSAIEYIRYGAIKPKDQMTEAGKNTRAANKDAIARDRLAETGRHNQATEGQAATNEAGRDRRYNNPVAKPKATTPKGSFQQVRDSKGHIRNLEYNAAGDEALSLLPDGTMVRYRVQNGKLIPVEKRAPKK